MPQGTCSIDDCTGPVFAKGWCGSHYKRWWRHGDPLAGGVPHVIGATCTVEGCDRPYKGHGFCDLHLRRVQTTGDPSTTNRRVRGSCSIDGCGKPATGRGWCKLHYRRWREHGDPLFPVKVVHRGMSPYERVLARSIVTPDGCVEFTGTRVRGYGQVTVKGKAEYVHRIVVEHHYGPMLDGVIRGIPGIELEVCHHCDNPPCTEITHLFLGTHADNMRDAAAKGRRSRSPIA